MVKANDTGGTYRFTNFLIWFPELATWIYLELFQDNITFVQRVAILLYENPNGTIELHVSTLPALALLNRKLKL